MKVFPLTKKNKRKGPDYRAFSFYERRKENMSDVLVVKINCSITAKELENIRKRITEQMKTGLVLIPPGYDIYVVSQDCDVKIEN